MQDSREDVRQHIPCPDFRLAEFAAVVDGPSQYPGLVILWLRQIPVQGFFIQLGPVPVLHQDLADKLHLLGLPIPLVQEVTEAACRWGAAVRVRKGARRYTLQHCQQAHVPHGGEVVPEVVVAEGVSDPIRKGAFIDLVLIDNTEVVVGAGQDGVVIQLPIPGVERLNSGPQYRPAVPEVWERVDLAAGEYRFDILHGLGDQRLELGLAHEEGIAVFKGPADVWDYEVQDDRDLLRCQIAAPGLRHPGPGVIEGGVPVEEAV